MNQAQQNNSILEKLFEYENYRQFLSDFFDEQKRQKNFFSHRYFAQKAGFSSPSRFIEIVKGTANLTIRTLPKMVKGLGLKSRAAEFFETLVLFNQSEDLANREAYYQKMVKIRKQLNLYKLSDDHVEYVQNWYYPVIREIMVYSKWGEDYRKLASLVRPSITEQQARDAVAYLLRTGMVRKIVNGKYVQESPALTTASVPAHSREIARKDILTLGQQAAFSKGPDERYIAYTTLSLSEENYKEVTALIDSVRARAIEFAMEEKSPDKVYQVVLQVFPLSETMSNKAGSR